MKSIQTCRGYKKYEFQIFHSYFLIRMIDKFLLVNSGVRIIETSPLNTNFFVTGLVRYVMKIDFSIYNEPHNWWRSVNYERL